MNRAGLLAAGSFIAWTALCTPALAQGNHFGWCQGANNPHGVACGLTRPGTQESGVAAQVTPDANQVPPRPIARRPPAERTQPPVVVAPMQPPTLLQPGGGRAPVAQPGGAGPARAVPSAMVPPPLVTATPGMASLPTAAIQPRPMVTALPSLPRFTEAPMPVAVAQPPYFRAGPPQPLAQPSLPRTLQGQAGPTVNPPLPNATLLTPHDPRGPPVATPTSQGPVVVPPLGPEPDTGQGPVIVPLLPDRVLVAPPDPRRPPVVAPTSQGPIVTPQLPGGTVLTPPDPRRPPVVTPTSQGPIVTPQLPGGTVLTPPDPRRPPVVTPTTQGPLVVPPLRPGPENSQGPIVTPPLPGGTVLTPPDPRRPPAQVPVPLQEPPIQRYTADAWRPDQPQGRPVEPGTTIARPRPLPVLPVPGSRPTQVTVSPEPANPHSVAERFVTRMPGRQAGHALPHFEDSATGVVSNCIVSGHAMRRHRDEAGVETLRGVFPNFVGMGAVLRDMPALQETHAGCLVIVERETHRRGAAAR